VSNVILVLVVAGITFAITVALLHERERRNSPQPVEWRRNYSATPADYLPMEAYGVWDYLARDGVTRFQFELVPVGGVVLIYIIQAPDYGWWRNTDTHATHRLTDSVGRKYICIQANLAPTNTRDAVSWMTYWAEQTVRYIRTGEPFS
jgi:hypothetical protein